MGKQSRAKKKSRHPDRPQKQARRPRLFLVPVALVVLIAAGLAYLRLPPRVSQGLPEELVPGAAAGFNVLLITLDTVRADRIGCYGYEQATTPVLDGLAGSGVRFADAVSVAPVTLPAHATILTGLDPSAHGVRHNAEFRLADEQQTLAELLEEQGYQTAAFVSAFVLDARFGLNQGFDHYDDDIRVAEKSVLAREGNERPADSVTGAAVKWLEERDRSRPFFAWVHYYDPHNPYMPPSPFREQHAGRLYDGEIAFVDSEMGRLLETVKGTGAWDRTLILVVADHGEGLGEHGEDTHCMLIYESTMAVPLILSCPGLFGGAHLVDGVVVSIADLFPTVLELLHLEDREVRDGISLLHAAAQPDRAIYQETLAPYFDSRWSPLYGLRRHGEKYILAPRPEYYDLSADPRELRNLADDMGEQRLARLVTPLEEWVENHPALEHVTASARLLDPESRERLEALGYVGAISREPEGAVGLPDPKDMMPVLVLIDQANDHLRAGRLEKALAVIRRAEVRSPRDRTVLRTKGKICLFMGRNRQAEAALTAANDLQAHPDACMLLAQMMIQERRFDEASSLLDRTLQLDPSHGGAYIARGDLQAELGRFDEAEAEYDRAARVDPYRVGDAARARMTRLRERRSATEVTPFAPTSPRP